LTAEQLKEAGMTGSTNLKLATCVAACAAAVLAAACGGGGGGAGGAVESPTPPALPSPAPTPALTLALREVASGLSEPLLLTAPAGDSRQFIVERPGRIRILADGNLLLTPFLDLTGLISTAGEGGLLSVAFHPNYASNGRFYLYYTDKFGNIAIDSARVSVGNPNVADSQSLSRIITIPHPSYTNHYGGMLAFGADGYLYAGTGDGGSAGDPNKNAQNLDSLLGKLLRLNVDGMVAPLYNIPADNPFVNQAGKRGEIWAYGLRNPWRFAFDPLDKQLYIADVGQDAREEVNIVPAATAAANYGWNIMEGSSCYNATSCNQAGITLPRFEYQHGANNANGCSITGGFVYRGKDLPELAGRYLYSDYCKGFLKSFMYSNGAVSEQKDWAVSNVGNVPSLGQDAQGELYLMSGGGKVYKIVRGQ
jgi:glucose/arabinose dehydrogenase